MRERLVTPHSNAPIAGPAAPRQERAIAQNRPVSALPQAMVTI